MVVRSKEKETKEEKTQAEMLEKDLFPGLYDKLNLSQFVIDKEKGTVDIPKLEAYLREKGFSEDAIKGVEEYLAGDKRGDKQFSDKVAAQIRLEYDCIASVRTELLNQAKTTGWLHDYLYENGKLNEDNLNKTVRAVLDLRPNLKDNKPLVIPRMVVIKGKGDKFSALDEKIELGKEIEKQLVFYKEASLIASLLQKHNFKGIIIILADYGFDIEEAEGFIAVAAGRMSAELEAGGKKKEAEELKEKAKEVCTTLSDEKFNDLFNYGRFEGFLDLGYSYKDAFNIVYGAEDLQRASTEIVFSLSVLLMEKFAEENEDFKQWMEENVRNPGEVVEAY